MDSLSAYTAVYNIEGLGIRPTVRLIRGLYKDIVCGFTEIALCGDLRWFKEILCRRDNNT